MGRSCASGSQISFMDEIWLTRPGARGKAPLWPPARPSYDQTSWATSRVGWHRCSPARRILWADPAPRSQISSMDEIWLTRPGARDKAAASTAFAARLRASGVRPQLFGAFVLSRL